MSQFIVSARKYRPTTFHSVVGQKSITTTLKNAIEKQKLAHAYLFFGPRGVGKTTCARIFAKTINCLQPTPEMEACNQCESCKGFNENRSYNIHELDAASNNSVEDIRSLIEQVRIPPQVGKYSTYIIDEVHMLSLAAFNAFLKTLEEPPAHAIFILATTEKHKIIPTILSRCQIFDFNRIEVADMVDHLSYIAGKEGISTEPEALNIIAQKADGAMRDALSIYDQIVSYSGETITYQQVIENLNVLDYEYYFRLTDAFLAADYGSSLIILDEILAKGFDGQHFLVGLAKHFRDLLICRKPETIQLLEVGAGIKEKYLQQAVQVEVSFALEALSICNQFDINYRSSKNTRLHIELALLQIVGLSLKKKSPEISESPSALKEKEPAAVPERPAPQAVSATSKPAPTPPAAEKSPEPTPTPVKSEPVASPAKPERKPSSIPSLDALLSGQANAQAAKKEVEQKAQTIVDSTDQKDDTSEPLKDQLEAEALIAAWKRFLDELAEDEPRLHSSLQIVAPQITKPLAFVLKVANQSILESLDAIKPKLTERLIRELRLSSLEIVLEQEEVEKSDQRIYTAEDKFQFLSRKNPQLLKLKQSLGLDFD